MSVFARYILRTAKRSPAQPVLILITLAIAVATLLTSAKLLIKIEDDRAAELDVKQACDITVSLSSESEARILFPDDVERVIGEGGKVLGEFSLTGVTRASGEPELFAVCATDILRADDFYRFRFTDYGEITERELNSSIIISKFASEHYGLGIGDRLQLGILNRSFEFEVEGIALGDEVLDEHMGIIEIGAVAEALTEANPALAALADGMRPASRVRVKLDDAASLDHYIEALKADERLRGLSVIDQKQNIGSLDFTHNIWAMLTSMIVAIAALIAIIVISTAQGLLAAERRGDTALFMICGADPDDLWKISYLESLIYSGAAAVFGLLLSIPMVEWINGLFEWSRGDIGFELYDILIAIAVAPLVIMLSTYINRKKTAGLGVCELMSGGRERRHVTGSYTALAVLGALTLLCVTATVILPVEYRFAGGFAAIIALTALAYFATPHILGIAGDLLGKLINKMKRVPARTYLALRTLSTSGSVMHSVRVLSVLLSLLLSISISIGRTSREADIQAEIVNCDYVILNADSRTAAIIEGEAGIDEIYSVGLVRTMTTKKHTGTLGISLSEGALAHVNPEIAPKSLPRGNEIAISHGIAAISEVDVGDTITFIYENGEHEYLVREIVASGANIFFFDAESIGLKNDLTCIRTEDGITEDELSFLEAAVESRGALMAKLEDATVSTLDKVRAFISLMMAVTASALVATVAGALNVLIALEKERGGERRIYFSVGMTRGGILAAALAEGAAILISCAILVPVFCSLLTLLIDVATNSFGIDIFF